MVDLAHRISKRGWIRDFHGIEKIYRETFSSVHI